MMLDNKVGLYRIATDILAKCNLDNAELLVGITDATANVVQFKFRGRQNNHQPVYFSQHVHTYTNDVCLKLYDTLLEHGLREYGPIYLGAEVEGNLRTLFVIQRNTEE